MQYKSRQINVYQRHPPTKSMLSHCKIAHRTSERQCLRLTAVQGAAGDLCPESPTREMHSAKSAPKKTIAGSKKKNLKGKSLGSRAPSQRRDARKDVGL